MKLSHLLQLLLLCLCNSTTWAKKYTKSKDATLLSNVRSLTLQADKQTSARRVKPIPQLKCVGGNGCKYYAVDVMSCKNSGSEYDPEDIQWTCQASLPAEFRLGSTEVICEGFDSPDDPYVLKGSCGVEYRLVLTELGEQKFLGRRGGSGGIFETSRDDFEGWDGTGKKLVNSAFTFLFWAVFIVVLVVIVRRIFNPGGRFNTGNGGGGWGGWGGGGGGGGFNDDPPPPYTPRAPPRSKPTRYSSSSSEQWRPGFWSGAAMGGAAGYMAGNRNQNRSRSQQTPLFGAGPSNYGGSSWGSGGGPSSFGAGPSSSRHESTGFGGTRRR